MIVVDASALVPALRDTGAAGDQVRGVLALHSEWLAPTHLTAEVLHVFRGLTLGRKITAEEGTSALRDYFDLGIELVVPDAMLAKRAWELRDNLSAYDALYVALAEQLKCELLTGDARIAAVTTVRCAVEVVDSGDLHG